MYSCHINPPSLTSAQTSLQGWLVGCLPVHTHLELNASAVSRQLQAAPPDVSITPLELPGPAEVPAAQGGVAAHQQHTLTWLGGEVDTNINLHAHVRQQGTQQDLKQFTQPKACEVV